MRRSLGSTILVCLVIILGGCQRDPVSQTAKAENDLREKNSVVATANEPNSNGPVLMLDRTEKSMVRFNHDSGARGDKFLTEAISAGLATIDFDADGLPDLYFLSGGALIQDELKSTNALYRNKSGFKFLDCTAGSGTGDLGIGSGIAIADYDQDGFSDMYLNNIGPNVLYRNNGDGTFSNVTASSEVDVPAGVGAGIGFLESTPNGLIDICVANYNHCANPIQEKRFIDDYHCYPSPLDFPPQSDRFFISLGDGTFADATEGSGFSKRGNGMGLVIADFDDDCDPDVFVANDMGPNFLYFNDGDRKFSEVGLIAGVAFNAEGFADGNMGVDVGDFNGDGLPDLFTTTYSRQIPILYENLGQGQFQDATILASAGTSLFPHVNWGSGFGDFNTDGFSDLFIANGDLDSNADLWKVGTSYNLANTILLNNGDGRFVDVSENAGSGLEVKRSSRGVVIEDLDADGRLDVVVLNSDAPATMIHNQTKPVGSWIGFKLVGRQTNRDAIGSKITITCNGFSQSQMVVSGRGYQSDWGVYLHFGLADAKMVDSVEIRWRSGLEQTLKNLPANKIHLVVER